METGGKAALPVFREVMLKTYQAKLAGPVPSFPANMENNIAEYLSGNFAVKEAMRFFKSPDAGEAAEDRTRSCRGAGRTPGNGRLRASDYPAAGRLPTQRWAW